MPEYDQLFDGTRRPDWAGKIKIDDSPYRASNTHSDERANKTSQGHRVQPQNSSSTSQTLVSTPQIHTRPISVSGIIVPCSTSRRKSPPNVPGRNLEGRPEDRGHIMAVSLGGPDVEMNIVPMPRQLNQKFKAVGSGLSWRQMEVLAAYNADLLYQGKEMVAWGASTSIYSLNWIRGTQKAIHKKTKGSIRKKIDGIFTPNVAPVFKNRNFVNNELVTLPTVAEIPSRWRRITRYTQLLKYTALVSYKEGNRGNSPHTIEITIAQGANASWQPVFCQKYNMDYQEEDFAQIDKVASRHRKKVSEQTYSAAAKVRLRARGTPPY